MKDVMLYEKDLVCQPKFQYHIGRIWHKVFGEKTTNGGDMAYKKSFTCILLRTADKRCFFTYKKHLKHVTEYFKTFGAEVFLAKAVDLHVLDLKELVQALCDPSNNQNGVKHTIVEKLYPIKVKSRTDSREAAKEIKGYIVTQFKSGEAVSLKRIKKEFQELDLTDSCLSNHLSRVRREFEEKGHQIQRIGLGKYRLSS